MNNPLLYELSITFLIFIIYSFIGYIVEIIYCSVLNKKLILNRGFLFGPIVPIYGIGVLLVTSLLFMYRNDPVVVFVFSIIITSSLEYFVSFLMEKMFHNKWWDYSEKKYNINGRICLENALLFGVGSCLTVFYVHPVIIFILGFLSMKVTIYLAIITLAIFITDGTASIILAYNLKKRIDIVARVKASKKIKILGIDKIVKESFKQFRTSPMRFFRAFPNLKTEDREDILIVKRTINKIKKEKKAKNKK